MDEDAATANMCSRVEIIGTLNAQVLGTFGLDSITVPTVLGCNIQTNVAAALDGAMSTSAEFMPGLGWHYIARLEWSSSTSNIFCLSSTDRLDVGLFQ